MSKHAAAIRALIRSGYKPALAMAIAKYPRAKWRHVREFGEMRRKAFERETAERKEVP